MTKIEIIKEEFIKKYVNYDYNGIIKINKINR